MARLPQPGGDTGNWGDILNEFLGIAHNSDGTLKDTGVIANKYVLPGTGIPETDLSGAVQTKLNSGGAVSSVNGQTGAVTLAKSDVGLTNVPNTDATARANHTGTQSADTLTDGTTNKAFLATERTKLTSLASAVAATDGQVLIAQGDGTSNWENSVDISNLAPASPLSGTEQVLGVQASSNVLITTQSIADLGTAAAVLHADISSNGMIARTASETYAARTITGTANKITVTNGDGVAGNPTITIPDTPTLVTPTIASFTNAQHTHSSAAQGGQIPVSSLTEGEMLTGSGSITLNNFFGPPFIGLKAAVADTFPATMLVAAGLQLGPGGGVGAPDTAVSRTATNTLVLSTNSIARLTLTAAAITTALPVTVVQPTIGSEAFRVQSTATNDDPAVITYQNRVATTNATVTTLHTATIPASTTVMLTATVVARRTGGIAGTAEDGASYIIAGTFNNVAGTATQIGTTTVLHSNESQAGWDCVYDVTGATARVRVTGATDNNITWHLSDLKWVQVNS